MKELLEICTTKVPFRDIDGKIYIQDDGVSMGSPLGCTFANFFMAEVETRAISNLDEKPPLYCRYVDDIFVICNEEYIQRLRNDMMLISGMNFTTEKSNENKLNFLNVLVDHTDGNIKTTVYRKPTDVGLCLNAAGDCPDQYKISVIKGFLHRARNLTTEKKDMMLELSRSKQILINNGYSNSLVDSEIKKFLSMDSRPQPESTGTTHKLFYRNFMSSNYRSEEMFIKRIIKDNVNVKNENDQLKIMVYYKSSRSKDLIMRNNLTTKTRDLSKTNLVYQFECQKDACKHLPLKEIRYNGLTTCTLSRRLSYHLQNGAILDHSKIHQEKLTRKEIVNWTKIRYRENDVNRLELLEALIILYEDPVINRQDTGKKRILKLYGSET